jgi:hypothetical protein
MAQEPLRKHRRICKFKEVVCHFNCTVSLPIRYR